jgi:hypothetical protein
MGTDGDVGVNFLHEFSSSVRRLAKIAFNYMAWTAGPDFAMRSEFDTARAFVRDGTEPSNEIVRPTEEADFGRRAAYRGEDHQRSCDNAEFES